MGKEGATRAWTPPQRGPKESSRHFIAILERKMGALKQMGEQGDREIKRKCMYRYDVCAALLTKTMLEEARK